MTDRRTQPVEWGPPGPTAEARAYAEATVAGRLWRVRMNDFPDDEYLYTLFVDGAEAESFHEWPSCWTRPATDSPPVESPRT